MDDISSSDCSLTACFHSDALLLVACLAFLISHSPYHWILFLCMSEPKRKSGRKPAASKISQGVACRHKCTSVGSRAAASVLLAEDLVWGRMGHLRTHRI